MNSKRLPGFSFVIPVLNGERFIEGCLKSIIAEMTAEDEITVVDNGSTDRTMEIVERFEQVRLIRNPHVTISTVRNRGAAASTREYLAFIDADCLVCAGWRAAAERILSNPKVSATGSIYDLPENPAWVEAAWYANRPTEEGPTHSLLGGNLVIRAELYEQIGGFDEELATDEDSDISIRILRSGATIMNGPDVRVIHLGNPKTIWQFYRKTKWHATSILKSVFSQKLDKPMAMTAVFIVTWLAAFFKLLFDTGSFVDYMVGLALLLFVPVLTVVYRLFENTAAKFFLPLIPLYTVYYIARSTVIFEALWKGITGGRKSDGRS